MTSPLWVDRMLASDVKGIVRSVCYAPFIMYSVGR